VEEIPDTETCGGNTRYRNWWRKYLIEKLVQECITFMIHGK
jgi:hypothetical protein